MASPLTVFENYLQAHGKSPVTISRYLQVARKFIEFAGEKRRYHHQDVVNFLAQLRRQGCSGNTLRWYHFVLRTLAKALSQPFALDEAPAASEDVLRPYFADGTLERMITRAREVCTAQQQAYLALATTYGLRRIEMASLIPQDIDLEKDTITIRARKRGRARLHLIPSEIRPYLEAWPFSPQNNTRLSRLFRKICRKAKVKRKKGMGWHSIRRSLVTALDSRGVSRHTIIDFMRWRGHRDIIDIYIQRSPGQEDQEVFAGHPYLRYWAGVLA